MTTRISGGKVPERAATRRSHVLSRFATKTRRLSIVGALVSAALVFGYAPSTAHAVTRATVTGTVVGSDGRPAVGVWVQLHRLDTNHTLSGSRTDELGRFSTTITSEHPRLFTLKFSCSSACVGSYLTRWYGGHTSPETATTLELAPDRIIEDVAMELPTGGTISGVVTTTDGAPLQHANVLARSVHAPFGVVAPGSTNERGEYTVKHLEAGAYTVDFGHSTPAGVFLHQYWPGVPEIGSAEAVEVGEGEARVEVDATLVRSSRIHGYVVDEQGIGFVRSSAEVTLYRYSDALGEYVGAQGPKKIENDGFFWFNELTAGTYALCVDPSWDDPTACARSQLVLGDPIPLGAEEALIVSETMVGGPAKVDRPQISGTARVWETLTASATSPTPGAVFSYQWYNGPTRLVGETSNQLRLTDAHLGAHISVEVYAQAPGRRTGGSGSGSKTVVGAVLDAGHPRMVGKGYVGSTLSAELGTWTTGTEFAYQWLADDVPIEGAGGAELQLTADLVGKAVKATVTGTKLGYVPVTRTVWGPPVVHGPVVASEPVITGVAEAGSTLTVSISSPTPGVEFEYVWHADGYELDARDDSLTLSHAHVGSRISVQVWASAPDYESLRQHSRETRTVWYPAGAGVTRLAGNDRFETSSLISSSQFGPRVPVAYVASGVIFADALAGAPVAGADGGPMLLTAPGALPAVTREELQRLRPERIVILGGHPSVHPAAEAELKRIRPGAVTRIGGADRYETSALISRARFEPDVPVAYVASGHNFPDALAAAPVAARAGGPVLLTTPETLPDTVRAELERLRPERIVILGSTPSVSAGVEAELRRLPSADVTRLGGADRYETAALISNSGFEPGVPVVYLSSGVNFPDALSGGPAAAAGRGPILLTDPNVLPPAIESELKRLRPRSVVILGENDAVNWAVQDSLDFIG